MARTANVEGFFKPRLSGSELKAKTTTDVAHTIIKDEAAAREEKTARLRAARLAREAREQPAPTAADTKKRSKRSR